MLFSADFDFEDGESTWSLQPPQLSDGSYFAPADLICTGAFRDTEIIFPIGRDGRRTDLTFFYWQAYVANERGRKALERICRSAIWFSPASTSAGEKLWVVRAPNLAGCIDMKLSVLTFHPKYTQNHPFFLRSEQIQTLDQLCLIRSAVEDQDLFYLSEYPMMLIISQRLVELLKREGITGVGCCPFTQIKVV